MSWSPLRKRSHREAWKALLLKRQRGLCALCGCRFPTELDGPKFFVRAYLPTFDHKVPRCMGGLDELDNLQIVHSACNQRKANKFDGFERVVMPRALRRAS